MFLLSSRSIVLPTFEYQPKVETRWNASKYTFFLVPFTIATLTVLLLLHAVSLMPFFHGRETRLVLSKGQPKKDGAHQCCEVSTIYLTRMI